MVQEFNLEQLPGQDEIPGHLDVGFRRGRLSRGMIMRDDPGDDPIGCARATRPPSQLSGIPNPGLGIANECCEPGCPCGVPCLWPFLPKYRKTMLTMPTMQ